MRGVIKRRCDRDLLYASAVSIQTRRRMAAALEVLGVYLAGAFLSDQIETLLAHWHLIPTQNPLELLTAHATNTDLLVASRQLLLTLVLLYGSYFLLIIPINWWYRRRGRTAYGLTRAGHPWKMLILAGLATSVLTQWPVLIHSLVDAIHPLGAMAPWRQAFFDMSWRRWQFWLFAGILSYAVIPVIEELIFRGYYQRRLAEDWGDGPAIIGTACFFTFAHRQYLIANAYNLTMIASLLFLAMGLGVVFAWTRSLIPSMIAHAIINVPLTPLWQGALLIVFAVGVFFAWRGGVRAVKQVFANTTVAACAVLGVVLSAYVIEAHQIKVMTAIAIGMLLVALVLEAIDRRESRRVTPASLAA
jgi:membrane protease YdiL (CAAX protease family)